MGTETVARCSPGKRSAQALPPGVNPELLAEYVAETLEHLRAAEAALLDLETAPDTPESIHTVFRAFHAIKAASGFLGLDDIQALAHGAENLLEQARDGESRLAGHHANLILESCDALKAMIQSLDGPAAPPAAGGLIQRLAHPDAPSFADEADEPAPPVPRLGDILVTKGLVRREAIEAAAHGQGGRPLGQALIDSGAASVADVAKALRAQRQVAKALAPVLRPGEATVRVSTKRLDHLIGMVGELVTSHDTIAQLIAGIADCPLPIAHSQGPPLLSSSSIGNRKSEVGNFLSGAGELIREIQDLAAALRMAPLQATFQRMTRLVRELGRKTGKDVRLVGQGEGIEIDRNMIEALNDPLTHLIRNAVDHGIEPPEERRKAGKPAVGTIRLVATHEAGNVVIELADDGRGLDREAIAARAADRGLSDAGAACGPRERDTRGPTPSASPAALQRDAAARSAALLRIICRPGFTTVSQATDVSGRGVGLDVVREAVERLRGRIELASTPGQGTTFTLRLPLTMVITDALLLRVGSERYFLPTASIQVVLRPEPGSVVRTPKRRERVTVCGEEVPVIRINRLFGIRGAVRHPCEGLLAVVEAKGRRAALLVDELLGQQQVVIRPLGKGLGRIPGIAGAAILGDGSVGLVLDPAGLAQLHGSRGRPASAEAAADRPAAQRTTPAAAPRVHPNAGAIAAGSETRENACVPVG